MKENTIKAALAAALGALCAYGVQLLYRCWCWWW